MVVMSGLTWTLLTCVVVVREVPNMLLEVSTLAASLGHSIEHVGRDAWTSLGTAHTSSTWVGEAFPGAGEVRSLPF